MKHWTQAEIGWVAGLIEGEGTITISGTTVRAVVDMTDEDVIRRLHEVTGIGNVTGPLQRTGNRKPLYRWQTAHIRDVARLFGAVAPLLGERRSARVGQALEAWSHRRYAPRNRSLVHGTTSGFYWEQRQGQPPCQECREAYNRYYRERRSA